MKTSKNKQITQFQKYGIQKMDIQVAIFQQLHLTCPYFLSFDGFKRKTYHNITTTKTQIQKNKSPIIQNSQKIKI